MTHRALNTVSQLLSDLVGVFDSFGCSIDRALLFRAARRIEIRAKVLSPPKPKLFVHASELLALSHRLMAEAVDDSGTVADPVAYRDGFIIAALIAIPARIGAFSLIRIGEHLRQHPSGAWTLDWAASETKGKREDHWDIPAWLVPALEIYLAQVRPALLARRRKVQPDPGHFWIGNTGLAIGHQILRRIIKQRSADVLGRTVRPHDFRRSAATTFVMARPGNAIEAAAILAHTDFRVTESFYIGGRRQLALQSAHRALGTLRRARSGRTTDPDDTGGIAA